MQNCLLVIFEVLWLGFQVRLVCLWLVEWFMMELMICWFFFVRFGGCLLVGLKLIRLFVIRNVMFGGGRLWMCLVLEKFMVIVSRVCRWDFGEVGVMWGLGGVGLGVLMGLKLEVMIRRWFMLSCFRWQVIVCLVWLCVFDSLVRLILLVVVMRRLCFLVFVYGVLLCGVVVGWVELFISVDQLCLMVMVWDGWWKCEMIRENVVLVKVLRQLLGIRYRFLKFMGFFLVGRDMGIMMFNQVV